MTNEELKNEIEPLPTGGLSEEKIDSLNGTKAKIANWEIKDDEIPFDEDWNPLPEGETRQIKRIAVITESIAQDELGNDIIITEYFNTKTNPNTGKLGWSTHEKSNANKFLSMLKLNHFKDCVGMDVVIIKKLTKKNRAFLGINY